MTTHAEDPAAHRPDDPSRRDLGWPWLLLLARWRLHRGHQSTTRLRRVYQSCTIATTSVSTKMTLAIAAA